MSYNRRIRRVPFVKSVRQIRAAREIPAALAEGLINFVARARCVVDNTAYRLGCYDRVTLPRVNRPPTRAQPRGDGTERLTALTTAGAAVDAAAGADDDESASSDPRSGEGTRSQPLPELGRARAAPSPRSPPAPL